ncbi:MAG: protein-methionine-sulfoxide reductase catalytic subunit MsrP [Alphaproteobacteria bacterium]|nr:protein-methionine-sulfoxide reductase catalytic subunit MsrP [Alphaproteobacteria bacterium]
MFIRKKPSWQISENEVTPEGVYLNRRKFMMGAAATVGAVGSAAAVHQLANAATERTLMPLKHSKSAFDPSETLTPYEAVTQYNNFYEFGTDKSDPAEHAWRLNPKPWEIKVEGMAEITGTFALEDVIDFSALEERIYRLRCVEGWSMVIPWVGVPLASVLKKFSPSADARYVAFETLADRKQMPGVRGFLSSLDWPYREGLRMDEAMNELAFLAVGLYGKELPNQNGAPVRLVVPWKYGFKSIKSIVKIAFVKSEPTATWNQMQPNEYGFYSNVNPEVDHPRWSQRTERRIGEFGKRKTLMFNGYEEQVAQLYAGMDLKKYY